MKQRDLKLLLADWALLFGTVYAAAGCLQSSFSLQVGGGLWLWLLVLTGLFNLIFRLKKTWAWALGALALMALVTLRLWSLLGTNLWQLCQLVLSRVAMGYSWVEANLHPQAPAQPVDFLPAMVLLGAALAYLLCAGVVWLRAVTPGVLWCTLAVAPCFLLTDMSPQSGWLLLLCACQLVLIFSHNTRVQSPRESFRAIVLALLPTALVLGLLVWCFPEQGYQPPITFEQLSSGVDELGTRLDAAFSGNTESTGGVQLRSLRAKPQVDAKVMDVTVDRPLESFLYLRGVAYEQFDGDGWRLPDTIPDWTGSGSPLDAQLPSDQTAAVTVRTVRTHNVLYTPQHLVSADRPTVYDYYIPNPDGLRSYTFEAYLNASLDSVTFDSPEQQRAERDCLALPEATRSALLALAEQNGLTDPSPDSVYARVQAVAEFVRGSAVYDLSPDTVPAGEDFCAWFLSGGKRGYCVHFAASAAAMYRALGIPARYVEGYVTETEAGRRVTVAQKQAHAWVEVFVEGRWLPIDPTPSSGVTQTAQAAVAESTAPTEQAVPETVKPTEESERPETPTEPLPTQQTEETQMPTQTHTGQREGSARLWWLLLLLPAALTPWLLRHLLQRRRAKKRAGLTGNALALWEYRRCARLCRACGTQPDAEIYALAQKARFSQHELSPAELDLLASAVSRQEDAVRRLAGVKRLWAVYWLL